MKETNFIKQNKKKWQEFEQVLDGKYESPEKLHDLFVQITDDLSYSRTFYPNRSVRVYLNSLAQRIFFKIYKNKKSRGRRLITFWTEELPKLMYEARRELLLSFTVFFLSFLIGVLSGAMDTEFANLILGEGYVQETLRNIDNGDPMAIYKDKGMFGMFLGITINNLWVAFLCFVLGATYIGSIGVLIRNGIMVGVFQYFFIERGLFWESFLTIWIHGTLEISAIIIAGTAGLTMGRGFIFPGTYRRLQAFQQAARRGIKIMIGIAPIIIAAGFFEGYLTRHTETPDFIRGVFILICLAFVLLYFVWYPHWKARVGFNLPDDDGQVPPDRQQEINFNIPKSSGALFSDVFVLFRRYGGRVFRICVGVTALFALLAFSLTTVPIAELFYFPYDFFSSFKNAGQFYFNEQFWPLSIIACLMLSLLIYGVNSLVMKEAGEASVARTTHLWRLFNVFLGTILLVLVFLSNLNDTLGLKAVFGWFWYNAQFIFLVVPFFLLAFYTVQKENKNILSAFAHAFRLIRQRFWRIAYLYILLFFLGLLFVSITDSILLWFFIDMISWLVYLEEPLLSSFSTIVLSCLNVFVINMVLAMLIFGAGLSYYTLFEMQTATGLQENIRQLGIQKRIRGIEKETSGA